ncbi:MAG: hypothetical protein EOM25_11840 [Deltaproteobacteria bacterium]|nr:hypothetical protein [Deltaproteobacteria bacterium]
MAYPTRLAEAYQGNLEQSELQEFRRYDWTDASKQMSNFFSRSLIKLPQGKTIFIYQFAPGNWVSMIEQGALEGIKKQVVQEDVRQFLERIPPNHKLNIVGLFCTHYPVFVNTIKNETTMSGYADLSTQFIEQGALAATYAYDALSGQYVDRVRTTPLPEQELMLLLEQAEPKIVLSGENIEQTKKLVQTIFPELHNIPIVREPFKQELQPRAPIQ